MSEINARVKLVEGLQFIARGDSGHAIVMDGLPKHGGTDSGVRPMELLLMGLGGCTGMDAISILRKKRQQVTSFEVNLKGKKAEADPVRFTDITVEFVVRGRNVSEEAVKRAIELSFSKYCPVKATLESPTNVGYTYRVEEDESAETAG